MTTPAPSVKTWEGATVVCLADGPSLRQEDVDLCRDRARVIAVNASIRLAPWADARYSYHREWWDDLPSSFSGLRYGVEPGPDVYQVTLTGPTGIETRPGGLRHGNNAGYQAMNLAVQLGAKRIVLLGYDMRPGPDGRFHWYEREEIEPRFELWISRFRTAVDPLLDLGVSVINSSRETALDMFPREPILEALRGARKREAVMSSIQKFPLIEVVNRATGGKALIRQDQFNESLYATPARYEKPPEESGISIVEPTPEDEETDTTPGDISTVTAGEARDLIRHVTRVKQLDQLETAERSNQRHPGGRQGVLNAIAARREELEG